MEEDWSISPGRWLVVLRRPGRGLLTELTFVVLATRVCERDAKTLGRALAKACPGRRIQTCLVHATSPMHYAPGDRLATVDVWWVQNCEGPK